MPLPITFVTSGLKTGGAEMMLLKLLETINRDTFSPSVLSLSGRGDLSQRLEALGIPVYSALSPKGLPRLFFTLGGAKTSLIIGWMYHGNVGAVVLRSAHFLRRRTSVPLIFKTTHTPVRIETYKRSTRWTIQAGKKLCRSVSKVLYCAESSKIAHEALGYPSALSHVLVDGFDSARFFPSPEIKESVRKELLLTGLQKLIGIVSRFHPHKDIPNTLGALRFVFEKDPLCHAVLIGSGLTEDNKELGVYIDALNLPRHRLHLLGRQDNVTRYMQAFDVLINGSEKEAFPNVIGEALLCEVPCVATDVGDTHTLVGTNGIVVPSKNPEALGKGVVSLLSLEEEERHTLGEMGRRRIHAHYDLKNIAADYEKLFLEVIG